MSATSIGTKIQEQALRQKQLPALSTYSANGIQHQETSASWSSGLFGKQQRYHIHLQYLGHNSCLWDIAGKKENGRYKKQSKIIQQNA